MKCDTCENKRYAEWCPYCDTETTLLGWPYNEKQKEEVRHRTAGGMEAFEQVLAYMNTLPYKVVKKTYIYAAIMAMRPKLPGEHDG